MRGPPAAERTLYDAVLPTSLSENRRKASGPQITPDPPEALAADVREMPQGQPAVRGAGDIDVITPEAAAPARQDGAGAANAREAAPPGQVVQAIRPPWSMPTRVGAGFYVVGVPRDVPPTTAAALFDSLATRSATLRESGNFFYRPNVNGSGGQVYNPQFDVATVMRIFAELGGENRRIRVATPVGPIAIEINRATRRAAIQGQAQETMAVAGRGARDAAAEGPLECCLQAINHGEPVIRLQCCGIEVHTECGERWANREITESDDTRIRCPRCTANVLQNHV